MTPKDILNKDDETDAEIQRAKNALCNKYRVDSIEEIDRAQLCRERREYWKQVDLQTRWCFLCNQSQSRATEDRFPQLSHMLSLIETNYHTMSRSSFVQMILDYYLCMFYDQWRNRRGIDKITGEPIPPHWWWPEVIEEHIMHHSVDPRFILEHTIRANWLIQLDLEKIMKKRDILNPRVFIYNLDVLKTYTDLQNKTFGYMNKLLTLRGALNKKSL